LAFTPNGKPRSSALILVAELMPSSGLDTARAIERLEKGHGLRVVK
jgi:hypothetical protein